MGNTEQRIQSLLREIYGESKGRRNFSYLSKKMAEYLGTQSPGQAKELESFSSEDPYGHLKGKVFAIAYPDNVYEDTRPTLETLGRVLTKYYPAIEGIHILPERYMSHNDVWPQDFTSTLGIGEGGETVKKLCEMGILDKHRRVTDLFGEKKSELSARFPKGVLEILDLAYNSHFNDGGFSQKDRSLIDPRFGTDFELESLCSDFTIMLDFVVNHLDVDNPVLDAYRRGKNSGDAFIIISPEEYRRIKNDGTIDATFRPRPFPLFTGMRAYADEMGENEETLSRSTEAMNRLFSDNGLNPLDSRCVSYLSIAFKHENDQGLTSRDERIFHDFLEFCREMGIDEDRIFAPSSIHENGMVFLSGFGDEPVKKILHLLTDDDRYAVLFDGHHDRIFGRLFYIYTTFSESQVDVNPVTSAGFEMIVDDLFHFLSSGRLGMLRMDAIKYLWKEVGSRNFDMEKGNKLIDVIRLTMQSVCPWTKPLDEINSPDSHVYAMGKEGGFSYVFGQVNAVPVAFNEGTARPLFKYQRLMAEEKAPGLLPFVMLSTHDGRSVQGIGVQLKNGHVAIGEFCRFRKLVEDLGGKAKFRSVPKGRIPLETWEKVMEECGIDARDSAWATLFEFSGSEVILKNRGADAGAEAHFLKTAKDLSKNSLPDRDSILGYAADWICSGITPYELCCTSRDSFTDPLSIGGMDYAMEADRLLCAQMFVLTSGQCVPAIYLNDLFGIKNNYEGYKLSGRPRDLNRKKSPIIEIARSIDNDPFLPVYMKGLNTLIELRSKDKAYYPGKGGYEYDVINDSVFLNMPRFKEHSSYILGNILPEKVSCTLDLSKYESLKKKGIPGSITDRISEREYSVSTSGTVDLEMRPYGRLWFSF